MRIAIGQLWQETNTFNPIITTRDDFEHFGVLHGTELVERMADTNELGGFIQSLRGWPEPPEIVGLVRLPAWPSGMATRETYDWIKQEFLTALEAAGSLDGVLLALHGAMVADGVSDVEGEILAAVRSVIGPAVPLVATLDLHANVTRLMAESADALVLFHTSPHIDVFETGQRGAEVLRRIIVDDARPVTAFQKIPAVFPAERANSEDPNSVSHPLKLRLQELERDPRVLTAGLATVQPWLDVPELGTVVAIVTDNDPELARTLCADYSQRVWDERENFIPVLTDLNEAVRIAYENPTGLIVLSDSADATTSGAPGDSTWVLKEMCKSKHPWPRTSLVTMVAPEIVEQMQNQPPGSTFKGNIGGKRDHRFSQPMPLTAVLENVFDARFILSGHLAKNLPIDMGPSIVLAAGNLKIVVTSRSGPHFAPQLFQAAGLDPFAAQVLVAKSPTGFRAAYTARAQQIMVVRAPGCAPSDFWNYDYHHIPRPLWPWQRDLQFAPSPVILH